MKPLSESEPTAAGPYRLHAELGRGGMGRVLLGSAPDGRIVAVKQVHARLAADDGFRARFRREVAASRKVSGAYTAPVLDADPDAPTPWLASAFVCGPSLGAAVETAGVLPEEPVRHLAAGLAAALAEIHRAGLIHRDLKPENVLLAEDGVRVIDFGIVRVAEGAGATALTQPDRVIGSPAFMSPEQAEGRELTPAGDVFSLGSVLVLAVTGRSPFAGASAAQALYNVVHAEPGLAAVPPPLRRIIEPCLAKDPAARPTPAQLLELIGARGHAGQPWPYAVHRMIAAQRADVDRLLGDPDRTLVTGPSRTDAMAAAPTQTAATPPQPGPVPPQPAHPPQRQRQPEPKPESKQKPPRPGGKAVAALVLSGVLAVTGIGAWAYTLTSGDGKAAAQPDFSPSPSTTADPSGEPDEPDKYTKMPLCSEAAGKLPLPEGEVKAGNDIEASHQAVTNCSWSRSGARSPHAFVQWDVKRSTGSDPGWGTEAQTKWFDDAYADAGTVRESELGFGDDAYWRDEGGDEHCALHVRDGNLAVLVRLGGHHTLPECRPEAQQIARAALSAMSG
ncbi:serine/threonine protein kinase [Streptomyces armeniacus]|uniref:Serine/threonine protein kinase n=1 Tax=Streptomyces armeniacus TaxID=83291 RepID=A0A345XSL8_9ACTN|nr:serine/threonine-protein kinase [Streptomyces armeniacus]AXK34634.1 serine/threonine protein kinase [Streptomyces armeniacus]